jgi:phospholipase/carboxylesterase
LIHKISCKVISFFGLAALGACGSSDPFGAAPHTGIERLTAVPLASTTNVAPGAYNLGLAATKDTRLIVPSAASPTTAIPLVVMLHGAGGDELPLQPVIDAAALYHVAVLLPSSRSSSWDVARGGFGEDILLIDKALQETFRSVRVDPSRIAFAGFSDGASYALSIGIANGDLISHVIAFAPGFIAPVPRLGKSEFYIVHGTQDVVTSPRNTEDNFVPFLRALGYEVQFRTFDGGHQVTVPEVDRAFRWFLGL